MRISFAAGVFFALLAGSTMIAQADEATPTKAHASVVSTQTVADVESPDVATWTPDTAAVASFNQSTEAAASTKSRGISRFASRILARTSSIAQGLTRSALRFIGTPYVFGGTQPGGFDCSGYTQHVFARMGLHIPRTADAQYYAGSKIRGGMKPGDLVFFQTYEPGPSHVGIYLGNGQFAHASSHGVMVSRMSDSYWSSRYIGAKRLVSR
ncbi:MAG: hypothetical protein NVSMB31_15840 [Vulcanimicrobiaceae bacterium]